MNFADSSEMHTRYKEFTIPKKNGKERKICAPSPELKRDQRSSLKKLYKVFFDLEESMNLKGIVQGFIPGRNVVSIAQKHVGYDSTTMLDISNFFDSVTMDMLQGTTPLEAHWFHVDGHTAQGFVTSPILACIVSLKFVEAINTRLKECFEDYVFTVYADDIQVSINNPTTSRIKILLDIIQSEVQRSGFEINQSKTRTKFSKYGYRRILGINVGDDHVRATRQTMRKIRAARVGGNNCSLGGLVTWSKCKLPNPPKQKARSSSH